MTTESKSKTKLIKKPDTGVKTCTVVLGMHRSGTSALTGMLDTIGIYVGTNVLKANDGNPKGYFENTNVYELDKELLEMEGSSWDSYDYDFNKINFDSRKELIEKAKLVLNQEFSYFDHFAIKDPRICLLFPAWEAALCELNIKIKPLLIFRNPMEVALSLQKRNGMSIEKGLILWMHYTLQSEYHTRKYQRLVVSYDDLLYNTDSTLSDIESFLSINVSDAVRKEANQFLDRGIKHNRLIQKQITDAPEEVTALYGMLLSNKLDKTQLDDLRNTFYRSLTFYQHKEIFDAAVNLKKENLELKEKQTQQYERERDLENELEKEKAGGRGLKHKLAEYTKSYFSHSDFVIKRLNKEIMVSHKLVDIIIPVYNAMEYVESCISSVLDDEIGLINQIIVVNDGSDPATSASLERIANDNPLISLIRHPINQGYTKAVNSGITDSTARYVVLLNSDTVVSSNWLEKLVRCAESDEKIGIVGPLSNAASWQSVPSLLDQEGRFKVNQLPENISVNTMSDLVQSASGCAYPTVPFVNGFCFLITRKVIDDIGIMDEENFPIGYGEENDYCIRARDAGFVLSIADDAYVYHAKSKSFGHSQRKELSEKGSRALKEKHGKEKVDNLVNSIKNIRTFDAIRSSVKAALNIHQLNSVVDAKDINILFILPSPGVGGGSHSIVQEVSAMQSLGINAKIAIEMRHLSGAYQRYKDINIVKDLFVGYEQNTLLPLAKDYDVVIATIYYSTQIVKTITEIYPHILPAYYVQDYEPMFFEEGSELWEEARSSYSLVNNMLLFAKTNWIAHQVAQYHGISVKKVVPSIDHAVYHPSLSEKKEKNIVYLAAMVRPQTPRRGAERTMRVLASLKNTFGEKINIQVFGCDDSNSGFKQLKNDFEFQNNGVLDRPGVASCLQTADIFIDLSDYQAFGRTSLEAMACRCTAMVPCFGGGDEYAVDGYNALVTDPFNESECISRLEQLINNPAQLKQMKNAAFETAGKFSPQLAALSEFELMADYLSVHRATYPKSDKPVVCLFPVRRKDNEPVGSAFVRLLQPYGNNSGLKENWEIITQSDTELPVPSQADIVIIQRDAAGLDEANIINWLLYWQAAGKKSILELDDDLFNFEGLYERVGGQKKEVKQLVTIITKLVSTVDAIIVSTPSLYQLASKYNENVFLIPNYLDPELWGISGMTFKSHPHIARNNDKVKIGYIGTPTHDTDLSIIKDAMKKVKDEYGDKVEIEVIGAFQKTLNNPLFGKAVALPKNTTYPKFVEWLKMRVDWDIAIIPLAENRFNQSKSHLKFLECSALGLASICSDVPAYSSIVQSGEDALLVKNNTEDWYRAIKLLIDDAGLREKLSRNAFMALSKNYTTHVNAELYDKVLTKVNNLPMQTDISTFSVLNKEKNKGIRFFNSWHNYIESDSRRKRLYYKFKNNPYAYFADSKNAFLRPTRFLFRKK